MSQKFSNLLSNVGHASLILSVKLSRNVKIFFCTQFSLILALSMNIPENQIFLNSNTPNFMCWVGILLRLIKFLLGNFQNNYPNSLPSTRIEILHFYSHLARKVKSKDLNAQKCCPFLKSHAFVQFFTFQTQELIVLS